MTIASETENHTMLERFDELASLARIYVEDGAPLTAAKKLKQLAEELEEFDRQKTATLKKIRRRRGS
jgi:hypothetical protein